MLQRSKLPNPALVLAVILLSSAVFVSDLNLPLGIATGVLYVTVVLLSTRSPLLWFTILAATACSVLTVFGFFISESGSPLWVVLINRGLAIVIIWSIAIVSLQRKLAEQRIKVLNSTQEQRIEERTHQLSTANVELEAEIKERQRADQALRESEERLAAILEGAHDAIISVDQAGSITMFNQGAERVFQYRAQDVIGQSLDLLLPDRFAEGHRSHFERFARSPEGSRKMNERGQLYGLRKDGVEFPAEASVWKIEVNGEQVFSAAVRDITERLEHEETLQKNQEAQRKLAEESATIAEIGRIISSSLDINEVYDGFAREMKKLVDFDRIIIDTIDQEADQEAEEFTVAYHYGVEVPELRVGTRRLLKDSDAEDALLTGRSVIREYSEHDAWAGYVDRYHSGLRSGISAPLIARGKALGIIGLQSRRSAAYRDREREILERITNQIALAIANAMLYQRALQSEDELQERAEELARSNRELEQFAYVASHDLQEPLRSISGFTRLLTRRFHDKLGEDADRFMDHITAGTQRMEELIQDLLAYSRVGRNAGDIASTDCTALVVQEIQNFQAGIADHGAVVTYDALPIVNTHSSVLAQVFRNLIGNAIKFHGEEPPAVHISAEPRGDKWIFTVQDNGIGMEPDHLERIFNIFQRLHTRDKYPGSGIGLSVCKKAVESLGGTISVESRLGQGSTFRFTVPISTGNGVILQPPNRVVA